MKAFSLAIVSVCGLACSAHAQSRYVLADRTNNAIYAITDLNNNGLINEPGEVALFFNATNAAGTLNVDNPSCMTVGPGGAVVLGDQVNRNIYNFRDLNHDGDALDVGESLVVADATNASAVSFAFPTGAAFDPAGNLYIVNAGNTFGNDGIYKLVDLDSDGKFQSAGEVTAYVGAGGPFGPGNGAYSPQEIFFAGGSGGPPYVGYLHNSSTNLHGVFKFVDLNGNGNCDDAGEFTLFWGLGNVPGIVPSAGFALEPDAARPGAMYSQQTATGSIDQVLRIQDLNNDGDAQDAGESVIVFSSGETGLTLIDLVSLPNGQLLLTDNSGKRVIVLTDLDNDGLFTSAGERVTYFANTSLLVGDIRQGSPFPYVCQANCDGSTTPPVLTANDFQCFLNAFASGSLYANCDSSSAVPLLTANDFQCFLNAFSVGCP